MFETQMLYDPTPMWWEAECVQYGLSYAPVRYRLTAVMGNHVVRLTDREYMMRLASKLQENHESQQRDRIEIRKLRPATIVPELRGLLPPESRMPRQRIRRCVTKLYTDAMKKCKQLPRILLTEMNGENLP